MIERIIDTLSSIKLTEPDLIERYGFAGYFRSRYFGSRHTRLLDVGGRVHTITAEKCLPAARLFSRSVVLDIDRLPFIKNYIRGDASILPFKDNRFDMVISLDVLEHIKPDRREEFLNELFRVSNDIVFLSFPFDSTLNREVDRLLFEHIRSLMEAEFKELKEHLDHRLPDEGRIIRMINDGMGIKATWLGYGGSLVNFLHFFFSRYLFFDIHNKDKLKRLEDSFLKYFYLQNFRRAPFYRAFIVASKQNQPGFKRRVDRIFKSFSSELESVPLPVNPPREEFVDSYRYLFQHYSGRKRIAVVIWCEGRFPEQQTLQSFEHFFGQNLGEQKYEFIVLIKERKKIKNYKIRFPRIRFIPLPPEQYPWFIEKILAVTDSDYLYVVSENNRTLPHAIDKMLKMLKRRDRHFVTFTCNSRPNEINSLETRELLLLNGFFKRRCFQHISHFYERDFRIEFDRTIRGYRVNHYQKYFSLTAEDSLIVMATHLFSPARGGTENLAKSIAEYIMESRYRVQVITTNAYSTEAFFLKDRRRIAKNIDQENGLLIRRMGFSTRFRRVLNLLIRMASRLNFPFSNYVKILRFGPRSSDYYRALISQKPDLIITAPFPMLNTLYARRAASLLNRPLITIPCFHVIDRHSFQNPILLENCRRSDAIIALTEFEKDHFVNEQGLNADNIFVIPPAIDKKKESPPGNRRAIRKRYGIREKHVLLSLGQHGMHKNILGIVYSMPYVWQKIPDTALVIAGATTAYTPVLKKEALETAEKSGGRIYFLDNFPDHQKDEIFEMSDVFISLSEFESFGIVFIEAMNYGLPVIGCKNAVVESIVGEFRSGLLVDPHNLTNVAGAVIELLLEPDTRKMYGRRSMAAVEKLYQKKVVKDKILGVIGYVINKSRGYIL